MQNYRNGKWANQIISMWSFSSDVGLQVKYEAYRTLLMLVKLERFGRIER